MKLPTKIIAVGLFAVAVSATGFAAPASAGDGRDCAPNRMCLWDDDNYDDRLLQFESGSSNLKFDRFNDKTSSVFNNTPAAFVLYDDTRGSDTSVCVMAGAQSRNLDDYGFGDKASSLYRQDGNSCPNGVNYIIQK